MTEMSLQGKVAVVTGAETETGVAVAVELARSGAAVAVQYFSSFGRAKDVVRGIEEFGGTAVAIKADLLDRAQTELMCAKAAGAFGDVDLMVVTDAVPAPDGDLGVVSGDLLAYLRDDPALTLVAYSPLLGGAYVREDRTLGPEFDHAGTPARRAALRRVAEETGATANQVVLAWLMGGDVPVLPLAGASSVAQLDESLAAVDLELTADQRATLDAAR